MTAGLIWVFVKLPQEWWIHVAQLDFTDFLAEHSWAAPLLIVSSRSRRSCSGSSSGRGCGRPTTPGSSTPTRCPSRWTRRRRCRPGGPSTARLRSYADVEKVVLLGLLSVIFAQSLPGVRASTFDLFVGIAAVVVVNGAITLAVARRGTSIESTALQFGLRILLNFGIVFLGDWLLGSRAATWTGPTRSST